jgi:hypothetical protein
LAAHAGGGFLLTAKLIGTSGNAKTVCFRAAIDSFVLFAEIKKNVKLIRLFSFVYMYSCI